MKASYSIIQKSNEYRILLTPVNIEVLPDDIQNVLSSRKIDISGLMIERISGESTTGHIHSDIVEMLKDDIKEVSGK